MGKRKIKKEKKKIKTCLSHPRCLRWLSVWLGGCLLPAYANCTSPTSPLDAPISPDMGSRRRVDLADAMAADDNTLLTHLRCCTMFPAAELPCAEFRADTCAACGCTANATCDNGAELGRFRCRMPPTTDLICNGPLGVSESVSLCASDATCCNRKYEHFEHGGVFIDNELWEYLWLIDPHPEIWPHIFMLALTTSFLVGRYSKRRKRKTRIKKRFGHMTHRHVSLIRTFSRCRFVGKQRVSPLDSNVDGVLLPAISYVRLGDTQNPVFACVPKTPNLHKPKMNIGPISVRTT